MKTLIPLIILLFYSSGLWAQVNLAPNTSLPTGEDYIYYSTGYQLPVSHSNSITLYFSGESENELVNHVSPGEFRPQFLSSTSAGSNDGFKLTLSNNAAGDLVAPVFLPASSRIIGFSVKANDTSVSNNLYISLYRLNGTHTGANVVGVVNTSGSSGVQTVSATSISNFAGTHGYFLKLHEAPAFDANLSLLEVTINYLP